MISNLFFDIFLFKDRFTFFIHLYALCSLFVQSLPKLDVSNSSSCLSRRSRHIFKSLAAPCAESPTPAKRKKIEISKERKEFYLIFVLHRQQM